LESLSPGHQVVKVVNEELIKLMGEGKKDLHFEGKTPFSLMLVGLQGSGKTTTAGKLSNYLRKNGRRPYLVPLDTKRPAAIEQLLKIGQEITIPVYPSKSTDRPEDICVKAMEVAVKMAQMY